MDFSVRTLLQCCAMLKMYLGQNLSLIEAAVCHNMFGCFTVHLHVLQYIYIQVETFNLIDAATCYSVFGCVTMYLGVLKHIWVEI